MRRAGKLKHKITLLKPVRTKQPGGGARTEYEPQTPIRAGVEPLQGREYYAGRQEQSEVSTRFRIRYRPGIDASWRVLFQGRTYELVSPPIDPNEDHRELHLMAVERTEGA